MDRTGSLQTICRLLREGGRIWLFLDYDGTLVPYAPTPAEARPDGELLNLLQALVACERIRTVILSGRPLASLREFLPIPALILAGLYGVEIQLPKGGETRQVASGVDREMITRVKTAWAKLIEGRRGFLLEDKGLSVALHSRMADPAEASVVIPKAQAVVTEMTTDQFRVLGGDRFLEIAPAMAHKGKTVEWFLEHGNWQALPVYFGDDDKDEEAFGVIRKHAGIPILVGTLQPDTAALVRLPAPADARAWLQAIGDAAR
jgi:trehalose 6-phosphate phosphatase